MGSTVQLRASWAIIFPVSPPVGALVGRGGGGTRGRSMARRGAFARAVLLCVAIALCGGAQLAVASAARDQGTPFAWDLVEEGAEPATPLHCTSGSLTSTCVLNHTGVVDVSVRLTCCICAAPHGRLFLYTHSYPATYWPPTIMASRTQKNCTGSDRSLGNTRICSFYGNSLELLGATQLACSTNLCEIRFILNGSLTLSGGASVTAATVNVSAVSLSIDSTSFVNVSARGTYDMPPLTAGKNGDGGSNGGSGGKLHCSGFYESPTVWQTATNPLASLPVWNQAFGGGGGQEKAHIGGGGRVLIRGKTSVKIDGKVYADGGVSRAVGSGSGAGGTVVVVSPSIGGAGTISASGGDGYESSTANLNIAGGGGGRIVLNYATLQPGLSSSTTGGRVNSVDDFSCLCGAAGTQFEVQGSSATLRELLGTPGGAFSLVNREKAAIGAQRLSTAPLPLCSLIPSTPPSAMSAQPDVTGLTCTLTVDNSGIPTRGGTAINISATDHVSAVQIQEQAVVTADSVVLADPQAELTFGTLSVQSGSSLVQVDTRHGDVMHLVARAVSFTDAKSQLQGESISIVAGNFTLAPGTSLSYASTVLINGTAGAVLLDGQLQAQGQLAQTTAPSAEGLLHSRWRAITGYSAEGLPPLVHAPRDAVAPTVIVWADQIYFGGTGTELQAAAVAAYAYSVLSVAVKVSITAEADTCGLVVPQVCSNMNWATGKVMPTSNYSLVLHSMGKLAVGDASQLSAGTVMLCGQDSVGIAAKVDTKEYGCDPGLGPGAGTTVGQSQGGGAGHGAAGGSSAGALIGSDAGPPYGETREPVEGGSGGGSPTTDGGAGGGVVFIGSEKQISLDDGSYISADGTDAQPTAQGGGGSGGTIVLNALQVFGTGVMSATGGAGGSGGGGGAGGRMHFYAIQPLLEDAGDPLNPHTLLPMFANFNGSAYIWGGAGSRGGKNGGDGTVQAPSCSLGQGGYFCRTCPLGTYKDNGSHDNCTACGEKPEGSQWSETGVKTPECPYHCDRGRVGKQCLTPIQQLINNLGGIIWFSVLVGSVFLLLVGGLCTVILRQRAKARRRRREKRQRKEAAGASPLLRGRSRGASGRGLRTNQKFYGTPGASKSDRTVHVTAQAARLKEPDLPAHAFRVHFSGSNSFRRPWSAEPEAPAALLHFVDPVGYRRFIARINQLASWRSELCQSEYAVYTALKVIWNPLSRWYLKRRRRLRAQRIRDYVMGAEHNFFLGASARALQNALRFSTSPDLTIGYIDVLYDEWASAPAHLRIGQPKLPLSLMLAGEGTYTCPFYLDPNDVLVRALPLLRGLKGFITEAFVNFVAGFNEHARLVDRDDIQRTVTPLLTFLQAQNATFSDDRPLLGGIVVRLALFWPSVPTASADPEEDDLDANRDDSMGSTSGHDGRRSGTIDARHLIGASGFSSLGSETKPVAARGHLDEFAYAEMIGLHAGSHERSFSEDPSASESESAVGTPERPSRLREATAAQQSAAAAERSKFNAASLKLGILLEWGEQSARQREERRAAIAAAAGVAARNGAGAQTGGGASTSASTIDGPAPHSVAAARGFNGEWEGKAGESSPRPDGGAASGRVFGASGSNGSLEGSGRSLRGRRVRRSTRESSSALMKHGVEPMPGEVGYDSPIVGHGDLREHHRSDQELSSAASMAMARDVVAADAARRSAGVGGGSSGRLVDFDSADDEDGRVSRSSSSDNEGVQETPARAAHAAEDPALADRGRHRSASVDASFEPQRGAPRDSADTHSTAMLPDSGTLPSNSFVDHTWHHGSRPGMLPKRRGKRAGTAGAREPPRIAPLDSDRSLHATGGESSAAGGATSRRRDWLLDSDETSFRYDAEQEPAVDIDDGLPRFALPGGPRLRIYMDQVFPYAPIPGSMPGEEFLAYSEESVSLWTRVRLFVKYVLLRNVVDARPFWVHALKQVFMALLLIGDIGAGSLLLIELFCIQTGNVNPTQQGECYHGAFVALIFFWPLANQVGPIIGLAGVVWQSAKLVRDYAVWNMLSMINILTALVFIAIFASSLALSVLVFALSSLAAKVILSQMVPATVAQIERRRPTRGWRGLSTFRQDDDSDDDDIEDDSSDDDGMPVPGSPRSRGASLAGMLPGPTSVGSRSRGGSVGTDRGAGASASGPLRYEAFGPASGNRSP